MWRSTKFLLSFTVPTFLLIAYASLWICKINQWDALAFITLIPFWIWAIPFIVTALITTFFARSRFSLAVLLIWFLTTLVTSVEFRGIFRSLTDKTDTKIPANHLRIVSVNCEGGSLRASHQVIPLAPDIVFIQEAPDRRHLEELTQRLYGEQGSFVTSNSSAIMGKGVFLTFAKDNLTPTIHARFRHINGTILDLTNVNLEESIPAWNFWKPSVRNRLRLSRIQNRKTVRKLIENFQPNNGQPIRIVGGDFSTPAGDDIFRPLKSAGLRDSFREAGHGAGYTFMRRFPFLRINQIWISPETHIQKTYTLPNQFSNHLMLISEFRKLQKTDFRNPK